MGLKLDRIRGIKLSSIVNLYLLFFCILVLLFNTSHVLLPKGEWDDYSFPIVSILKEHNFGISQNDVENYRQMFPNWDYYVDYRGFSGFMTRQGDELTWYFPIYSIVCIPAFLILRYFSFETVYTFPFTNLVLLVISLLYVFSVLKTSELKRTAFVFLLSFNPILFYIGWPSAEVFIYSFLIMGLTSWYNKWYKRAALFIAIAGMLNPVILSVGIIMIIEYFVSCFKRKGKTTSWSTFIKSNILGVISFGACFVPGLIPMAYNYYQIGHINITAAYDAFTSGHEPVYSRVIAYIFDLNYGIYPYYPVLLILGLVLLVMAIVKRHYRFLEWLLAFVALVIGYSVMVHINNGMSGIARYNSWGVLPLMFGVVLFGGEIIEKTLIRKLANIALVCGYLYSCALVLHYNPYLAIRTDCMYMTPVARKILDYAPSLYSPLYSTFNSRVSHIDGGYDYANETPIIYVTSEGEVRKVLASSKDIDYLKENYSDINGSDYWVSQIDKLGDTPSYINVPPKYDVRANQ